MPDQKMVSCKVCGASNAVAATTCGACGVSLTKAESLQKVDDLLKDLLESPAKADATDSLDLDGEIVNELLDSIVVEEKPAQIQVDCPLCGTPVAADATSCARCGSVFAEVSLGPAKEAPARVDAEARGSRGEIPVAAATTEAPSATGSRLSARFVDLVIFGTVGGLIAIFVLFKLYTWPALTESPMPLALFFGTAAGGMGFGYVLFLRSSSAMAEGDRLLKAGRFEEAILHYDRAIRLSHRPSDAYTSRGIAFKRLGRNQEALQDQQKAVKIDPDNEIAWCNLGDLYFRIEDFEGALDAYDRALQIRPRYAIAWNNKGAALARTERFEEARVCHDRAVGLAPKYVAAWLNRGEVLARLGDRAEAQKCLERARALGA